MIFFLFFCIYFICFFQQIEGLLDDEDFRAKVTREEFEEMCKDLFNRVAKPVEDALSSSQVTLVGQSSRA